MNKFIFREGWNNGNFFEIETNATITNFKDIINLDICNDNTTKICAVLNNKNFSCTNKKVTASYVHSVHFGKYSWVLNFESGQLSANYKYIFREDSGKGDFYLIITNAINEEFEIALKGNNWIQSLGNNLTNRGYIVSSSKVTIQKVYEDFGGIYSFMFYYKGGNLFNKSNLYIFRSYYGRYYKISSNASESEFTKLVDSECTGLEALKRKLNKKNYFYSGPSNDNDAGMDINGINNIFIGIYYNWQGVFYRYMYEEYYAASWNEYYEIDTNAPENFFKQIAIDNKKGNATKPTSSYPKTLVQRLLDEGYKIEAKWYGYWDHSDRPKAKNKVIADYKGQLFMRDGIENINSRNYREFNGEREDEFKNQNNLEYVRLIAEYPNLTEEEKDNINLKSKEIIEHRIIDNCTPANPLKNLIVKMPGGFNGSLFLEPSNNLNGLIYSSAHIYNGNNGGTELIVELKYRDNSEINQIMKFIFKTKNSLFLNKVEWHDEFIKFFDQKNNIYSNIRLDSIFSLFFYIKLENNGRAHYDYAINSFLLNKIADYKDFNNLKLEQTNIIQPYYTNTLEQDVFNFKKRIFIGVSNIDKVVINKIDKKMIISFKDSQGIEKRIDIYFKDIENLTGAYRMVDRSSAKDIIFKNANLTVNVSRGNNVENDQGYSIKSNIISLDFNNRYSWIFKPTALGDKIVNLYQNDWFDSTSLSKFDGFGSYSIDGNFINLSYPPQYDENRSGFQLVQYIDFKEKGSISLEFEPIDLRDPIEIQLPSYNPNYPHDTSFRLNLNHDGFILAELRAENQTMNFKVFNFQDVMDSKNLDTPLRVQDRANPIIIFLILVGLVNLALAIAQKVIQNCNTEACKKAKTGLHIAQIIFGIVAFAGNIANISNAIGGADALAKSINSVISALSPVAGQVSSGVIFLTGNGTIDDNNPNLISYPLLKGEVVERWKKGLIKYFDHMVEIKTIKPKPESLTPEAAEALITHAITYSSSGDIEFLRSTFSDKDAEKTTLVYLENILRYGAEYIYESAYGELKLWEARLINIAFVKRNSIGSIKTLCDAFYGKID